MPRHQQRFDEETAAARQRLIEQLQQLSKEFSCTAQSSFLMAHPWARLVVLACGPFPRPSRWSPQFIG